MSGNHTCGSNPHIAAIGLRHGNKFKTLMFLNREPSIKLHVGIWLSLTSITFSQTALSSVRPVKTLSDIRNQGFGYLQASTRNPRETLDLVRQSLVHKSRDY